MPRSTGEAARGDAISARGLEKRYGDLVAVDGIDADVFRGESFAFLGPNGAGKSSTMRMVAAMSPRSGGDLRVLGEDPDTDGEAIRARLGVVPQENNLDPQLTVEENLLIYGRYFGLPRRELRPRITELLEFAELTDRRGAKAEYLSGGMKRRLVIARGLVNRPDLILLDEPTTGLDPQARNLLWDRLRRLKRGGATLILTTHYMDEAEQLCDRLVIMDHARIVAEGTPAELIAVHAGREVVELHVPSDELDRTALDGLVETIEVLPDRVLIYTGDSDKTAAALVERGLARAGIFARRASLEDVFLRLTGRTLVD
ncbi:ABC transporter ATP-binding protein [Egibacter rhizosphaerae]|uniref:ABC transporter ATP-binding protein n=1 Tax=Egibacter rhizosphaerae TaxID=1670831 RepID=A0A411YEV5_9ACTN|nr:ABC transporter ATP-binding protein [Egibacter rhizosphaerae]QBI19755.1 ABC transporter ATP-binding protein [Egibacter rhizosphaerae]